jgi:hypothetical protein
LKCPTALEKKDSAESSDVMVLNANDCLVKKLSDEQLKELYEDSRSELLERAQLEGKSCTKCVDISAVNNSLLKEKVKLEEEVSGLRDELSDVKLTVNSLRDEYRLLSHDCITSEKALIDRTDQFQKLCRTVLVNYRKLSNREDTDEVIVKDVEALSLEDLVGEINNFNLDSILELLRTGITQYPEEKVTVQDAIDNQEEDTDKKKDLSFTDDETRLMKQLVNLEKTSGLGHANAHLNRLMQHNRINSNLSLDQIKKIVAELE